MSKIVQDYILVEVIGSGQYGRVWRAEHLTTKEQYAIKSISIKQISAVDKLKEFVMSEIQCLELMQNKNIVKYYGKLQTPNNYYLIFEFCRGGTLEDIMKKEKMIEEHKAVNMFLQILNAFTELQRLNIMHRDLKPSNVLLDGSIVKLADFGFCKKMKGELDMTKSIVGSPIYMAPELLQGRYYCTKADIWSLGVMLFEMIHGRCPYEENSIPALLDKIKTTEIKYSQSISQDTLRLLQSMLVFNPSQRITWNELFKRIQTPIYYSPVIESQPPLITKPPIIAQPSLIAQQPFSLTTLTSPNHTPTSTNLEIEASPNQATSYIYSIMDEMESNGMITIARHEVERMSRYNASQSNNDVYDVLKNRYYVKFIMEKIKQLYLLDVQESGLLHHAVLLLFKKARKFMITTKIKITYCDIDNMKNSMMDVTQLVEYIEQETVQFDVLYGYFLKDMCSFLRSDTEDSAFIESIDKPFEIDESLLQSLCLELAKSILDKDECLSMCNFLVDISSTEKTLDILTDFKEKEKIYENYCNRLTNRELRSFVRCKMRLISPSTTL